MQIHFICNATLIIQSGSHHILVDPMLGSKGCGPSFAFFRHRSRRNPIVGLPANVTPVLETITAGLITHRHFDHLDPVGAKLLAQRQVPVYCTTWDKNRLQKQGMTTIPLHPRQPRDFLGGKITAFETTHGYGLIGKLLGRGAGYLLELPNEPSLYISGDTVLTPTVLEILTRQRPDIAVLAAGGASLDLGKPILMPMEEILGFIRLAPGTVIATHMEALNHCPVTRAQLREAITQARLDDKVRIPTDGEVLTIEVDGR
jgi:L-ascorbate metabolism protein UlaG (beta-lactamase superfamily)